MSRKVAGSNAPEFIGFFNVPNPSNCTISLGPTQPLTEMSERNLRNHWVFGLCPSSGILSR
jgi:hypothetical protein